MSGPGSTRPARRPASASPAGAPTCPSACSPTPTSSASWTRPTSGSARAPASASGASPPRTRRRPPWAPSPAKRAIAVAGLAPDDIDLIIVATLTPDYPMPSTAVLVKEAIGNRTAAAFDVAAACSGLRLRLRHGRRLRPQRHGPPRAGHRRGAAHALPRLLRPQHLHPLRRRRRRGRAVRLGRGRAAAWPAWS